MFLFSLFPTGGHENWLATDMYTWRWRRNILSSVFSRVCYIRAKVVVYTTVTFATTDHLSGLSLVEARVFCLYTHTYTYWCVTSALASCRLQGHFQHWAVVFLCPPPRFPSVNCVYTRVSSFYTQRSHQLFCHHPRTQNHSSRQCVSSRYTCESRSIVEWEIMYIKIKSRL